MKKLFFAFAIFFSVAANAQLQIPHSVKVISNESGDWKYGPWATTTSAKTNVPSGLRVGGLTVYILSCSCEYWWLDTDLTDGGLIVKSSAGGWGLTGTTTLTGDVVIDAANNTLKFIQDVGGIGTFNESLTLGLIGGITPGVHLKHSSHSTTYTSSIDMDDTNGLLLKTTGGGGPITIDGSGSSSGAVNITGTSTLTGQINFATKPTRNDAAYQLLARDSTTGQIQFVKKSSISGGGSTDTTSLSKRIDYKERIFNVELYHAAHDAVIFQSGITTTSGSAVISDGSARFTSAMVGKVVLISGAGAAGAALKTTVLSFTSTGSVTLSTTASTTVSSGTGIIGTDDTAAIQAAINACHNAGGGTVFFPNGIYLINGALQTSIGSANPNCQIYIPSEVDTSPNRNLVRLIGESTNIIPFTTNVTLNTGVILFSTLISVSGVNPSVIGTIGNSGNYLNYNFTDIYLERLNVRMFTNGGTHAPYINGINFFHAAKASGTLVSVTTDLGINNTVTAAGTKKFGMAMGGINDNGPNHWQECNVQGFEYGYIPGEHTTFINCYTFGNNNGYAILRAGHVIKGSILSHNCINQVYIPSPSTFFGQANNSGVAMMDLALETENDVVGKWFDTQTLLLDSASNGAGTLKFWATDAASTATLKAASYQGAGSIQLSIVNATGIIGNNTNTNGGAITPMGVTTASDKENAILEVYNSVAATSSHGHGVLLYGANQSNTGTAPIGSLIAFNTAATGTNKIAYFNGTYTSGANNTFENYEYITKAGTLTQVTYKNPDLYQINVATRIDPLAGTGTRLVTADASGNLSTTTGPTIIGLTTTHHLGGSGTVSVSLGTGAGSGSPSFSAPTGTTDLAGRLDVVTGTSPTGSNVTILTLTFASAYTHAPFVILTPASNDAAALTGANSVYVETTTTTFVIKSGATGLNAGGDYKWYYHVIE